MTELFMTILDMSLKASFVILSVYLARWFMCLGNPPRKWCYMLWGIVLIRLLLPVTITSPISSLPDEFASGFTEKWGDDYVGETQTFHDIHPDFQQAVEHGNRPITTNEGGQYVVTGADGISHPKTVKSDIFPTLAQIWLIGIGLMLLWNGIALWMLRRKLQEALPLDHQTFISDQIDTAFVLGFFSPKIYLPASLSVEEQKHILRHERYHIYRQDHRIKIAAFLALCIHWFNPLVWLAYVQAMRDMELSCDEAVTAEMQEQEKADYAQTLLNLTTGHKRIHVAPVAFGEGDTAERIRHVFYYRDPGKVVTIVVMVIFAISAVQLLTDPKEVSYEFGASMYGYERIAYTDFDFSQDRELPSLFCLTTDDIFWVSTASEGWEAVGTAEPYSVTAAEINSMMPYRLVLEDPPPITRVTDSKIIQFTDENGQHLFYLLSRHETGSYFIGFGRSTTETYEPETLTIYYLFPVMSGVGKHSSNGPFYQRCLESMLDNAVDVFSTQLVGDGYQIVGLRTGIPKTDYGWAVFHVKDNMVTFTGQLELYDNAAEYNNGIIISSHPALANDTGEITDKTAYDVILIANPEIVRLDRRITNKNGSEKVVQYPEIDAPDMIVIPWTQTAGPSIGAANNFYDAEGNIVPDSKEQEERLQMTRMLEENIRLREHLFANEE